MTIEGRMLEQEPGGLLKQWFRTGAMLRKRSCAERFPNGPGRFIGSHRPVWQGAKVFSNVLDYLVPQLAKFAGAHLEGRNTIPKSFSFFHFLRCLLPDIPGVFLM